MLSSRYLIDGDGVFSGRSNSHYERENLCTPSKIITIWKSAAGLCVRNACNRIFFIRTSKILLRQRSIQDKVVPGWEKLDELICLASKITRGHIILSRDASNEKCASLPLGLVPVFRLDTSLFLNIWPSITQCSKENRLRFTKIVESAPRIMYPGFLSVAVKRR